MNSVLAVAFSEHSTGTCGGRHATRGLQRRCECVCAAILCALSCARGAAETEAPPRRTSDAEADALFPRTPAAAPGATHAPANADTTLGNDRASSFSLWGMQGDGKVHTMYHDPIRPRRTITEGDIIHIIVEETASATVTANTDLKRRVEADAQLKSWLQLNDFERLEPNLKGGPLNMDISSQRRTQGLGRRDRRDQMQFRIAARVLWDLGDGTLFISAKKIKTIHDEESILTLSGYVRRDDVDGRLRVVRSERIYNLKLAYTGSGTLASNYTRSFWGWILDKIWF